MSDKIKVSKITLKKIEPKLKAIDIRKNWVDKIKSIGKNSVEDLDISQWEW